MKILAILISVIGSPFRYIKNSHQTTLFYRETEREKVTYSMLPMVIKHQSLSHSLPLIITTPNTCNTQWETSLSMLHILSTLVVNPSSCERAVDASSLQQLSWKVCPSRATILCNLETIVPCVWMIEVSLKLKLKTIYGVK